MRVAHVTANSNNLRHEHVSQHRDNQAEDCYDPTLCCDWTSSSSIMALRMRTRTVPRKPRGISLLKWRRRLAVGRDPYVRRARKAWRRVARSRASSVHTVRRQDRIQSPAGKLVSAPFMSKRMRICGPSAIADGHRLPATSNQQQRAAGMLVHVRGSRD